MDFRGTHVSTSCTIYVHRVKPSCTSRRRKEKINLVSEFETRSRIGVSKSRHSFRLPFVQMPPFSRFLSVAGHDGEWLEVRLDHGNVEGRTYSRYGRHQRGEAQSLSPPLSCMTSGLT